MKLIIIGVLNLLLMIQVYAQQPMFKDTQEIEQKVSKIVEDLKNAKRLNGKELSNAISPYVKNAEIIKNISMMDVSKSSDAELKKMLVNIIQMQNNRPGEMCLKEEASCLNDEQTCCAGLKCSIVSIPKGKMCKGTGVQCTDDASCCSGSCEPNGKIKSCTPMKRCLRVLKQGENCVPSQSICDIGFCGRVNINSTNLLICANDSQACKSSSDCCSKKCESNRCVQNFQCQSCKGVGQKVKGAEKCCEGYYPDLNGTCISDYPPARPVSSVPKKKILQHIIDLIVPSAEADVLKIVPQEEGGYGGGGTSTGRTSTGGTSTGRTSTGGTSTGGATGGTSTGGTSTGGTTGGTSTGGTNLPGTNEQDSLQHLYGCEMKDEGVGNNPYADFKTCTYASKKLYYRQLCPNQRAAVDWSRAFEFMASGDGVKDFWTKDGKSIYDRAKLAADEIKTNRLANEKSLALIDDFMTCNCLSMKKANDPSVTATQKEFLASSKCAGFNSQVSDSNSAQLNTDASQAQLDEGSSSLKYQELLIEYFTKTAEVNAQLLIQNTNTLTKLSELSDYLNSIAWDGKKIEKVTWSESKSVSMWTILVNLLRSLVGFYIGFYEWSVSQIFGNNSQVIWTKVADLWNQNPNKAECREVDRDNDWWHWRVRYKFDCYREDFVNNNICGKKIYDALCIKMAASRSDTGPLRENKFLIDPLFPKSMVFSMDSGFVNNYDLNVSLTNPGYVPPNFTATKQAELIKLATQYAIDQDFYENISQREEFANYVFDVHFIRPYSNTAAGYPAPGLIPYYEDGVQQLAVISNANDLGAQLNLARLENYGNLWNRTKDQFQDRNVKIKTGKSKKIQNTIKYAKFLSGSLKNLNGNNSMVANNNEMNDNLFSGVDAFSGLGSAQNALGAYNKKQKEKLDNWNKHVGSTSRGKKLSEMKDLSNRGVTGAGGAYSSSSGSSSNGGGSHPNQAKLDEIEKESSESDYDKDSDSKVRSAGQRPTSPNRGSGMSDASGAASDSSAADADNDHMMTNIDRNKNAFNANEDDTLFSVVSKTYMRNLDKILTRKKKIDEEANALPVEPAKAE